ncbi:hypothetical protein AVEN_217478-1 [Araneus ventricosus]|uniref:Uncharacterized protein n=1 Tax=Araneus ventricosus TaxID=182803 RepID=A0A4Y2EQ55_ARAVE|nr:hypothetical protein AVEN_245795-1 [Araneus ventricosus]GBM30647.1 hypothetical protein AVEN_41631-1 [Araneus ventricosus]GBM30841.1 hypothetical protein AVEN_182406-1 [Araneus ventricosus]GBM30858.1 hypothetical protein AVEN_217478-1 [Araneus ventricosus]
MPLFWRFTTAMTCAAALSPGFLFKPVVSMEPERRAALAGKLKKLIDDFEGLNTSKVFKNLDAPLKQLLQWLEKSNALRDDTKCHAFQHIVENNNYFSRDLLMAIHNFITG